jgi:predicted SAM-dependent methyltransferase
MSMRLDSENFSKYQKFIPSFLQSALIKIFYRFRSIFYRGNQVHCNCCNTSFRLYLPPFQECPGCGSQARQRLMLFYLKNKTDFFTKQHHLLHFAPENCLEKLFRRSADLEYLTADLNSHRAMEKIDMTNIPYSDDSFSIILCSHVLEHIPEDLKAMKELKRVLTRDGWAILQVPMDKNRESTYEDFSITSPEERQKHFGRFDHCRLYGRDYKDRLTQAGFEVTVDDYVKTFSAADVKKYGFEDWEDIYFCKKSIR